MKTLVFVYWLRLILGIVAALLCTGYGVATGSITRDFGNVEQANLIVFSIPLVLMNSISIMLAVYLISYYALKIKYAAGLEKPQKLVTMGIGVYLLAWLVLWTLLYTVIAGA